jgi:hypothetical protein
MRLTWIVLPVFAFVSSAEAQPALIAVMPAQGVNLTEGQCDAIGVIFANAFAREANVTVASPMETRNVIQHAKTAQAAAAQLGAVEYIELRAVQLSSRVILTGIRYDKAGKELFRAEISAWNLDDMELASTRLARALAWRQPISNLEPYNAAGANWEAPPLPAPAPSSTISPNAFGLKSGFIIPAALYSHRYISPMLSLQFDGRMGTRDYFIEFGAGVVVSTDSQYSNNTMRINGVFAELGGSYYLSKGSIAPYIGGGVSPRILNSSVYHDYTSDYSYINSNDSTGARCAFYGQIGVTFTRDSRSRVYSEFRVSQNVIGITDDYSTSEGTGTHTYYPTEFALQVGIGW